MDQRNFDPVTQQPSSYVNDVLYAWVITVFPDSTTVFVRSYSVDPTAFYDNAVCDNAVLGSRGLFYTDLTDDDVGGLVYLYSRTNINVETLGDSVYPANNNTSNLVRTAPRPGLEKITFIRHPIDAAGSFRAMTNEFIDTYFTNGTPMTQAVQRITSQPDFIFSAKDTGFEYYDYNGSPLISLRYWQGAGSASWINNSDLNGNPGGDGPGVIRPQAQITFATPGKYAAAAGGAINGPAYLWNWATFDGSTNAAIMLAGNETNATSLTLSARTVTTNGPPSFEWMVLGHQGGSYRIDASTNLTEWTHSTVITNTNGIFVFKHPLDQPQQYFRTVLQ